MDSESTHDDDVTNTSSLLPRIRPDGGGAEDSATVVVVVSTFVAVAGSYAFGSAVSIRAKNNKLTC